VNPFGTHDHKGDPVPLTPVVPITLKTYPKQTAWSYSGVQQHNTCPLVIRFRKIDRLPEPKSEHLQRGLDVHAAMEQCIKTEPTIDVVTRTLEPWLPLLDSLRRANAQTEVKLAFDKNWKRVPDYFSPDAWLRVVLDAVVVAVKGDDPHVTVWEWKTGKAYEDHAKQARLYALAALLILPEAMVDVRIRYLDRFPEGHDVLNFTPQMLPALKKEFEEFSHDYLNDEIYPAKPNRFCRNCHFRNSNGGPCAFG
jgi:CRISPR/Cas system-associated exonuclease Cas4 (RecB family)